MKKRTFVLAPVLAAALVVAAALPADAAVTYTTTDIAVSGSTGIVATDTSSRTIYAASSGTITGDLGAYSIPTLSVVDPSTKKVTAVIRLDDGSDYDQEPITDIKVRSSSHRIWVLTAGWQNTNSLWEINGSTNTVIRRFDAPRFGTLALEQTADIAFVAGGSAYNENEPTSDMSTWTCVLQGAGRLQSFDGATGAIKSVVLPSPAQLPGVICEAPKYDDIFRNAIAFDQANHSLQIAGTGSLWAYSNKLALAHTLKLPYSSGDLLSVTADGATNTVYVGDGTKLTVVNGATGTITANRTYSRGGAVVIDPSISTLYLGQSVIDTKSFNRTGTLPYAAQAVNGTTHSIYSPSSDGVFVTTRKS